MDVPYSMFPIKRTVFLCTATVLKNTVRLIGNIEYGGCIWSLVARALKANNSLLVSINAHTTILRSQMVYPYVLIWVGGVFAHPPKIENNSISSLFRDFDSFLSYFSI
jgi:hypothetical protein